MQFKIIRKSMSFPLTVFEILNLYLFCAWNQTIFFIDLVFWDLIVAYWVIWIQHFHRCHIIDVNCLNFGCTTFSVFFNCTRPCGSISCFTFNAKSISTIFDARKTTFWHRYFYRLREFYEWNSIFVKWLEFMYLKAKKKNGFMNKWMKI